MRWQLALAIIAPLAAAASSRAEVVLQLSDPVSLNRGLMSRNVTVVATEGEYVEVFSSIRLTNAHQVWGLGDQPTIRVGSFPAFGYDLNWSAYDSHLLIPDAQQVGSIGAPLMETNDKSTTGALNLPPLFTFDAPSGFGTLASADGTDSFALRPHQDQEIPFLHVVGGSLTRLDVRISFYQFIPEPFTVTFSVSVFGEAIPEPGTFALCGLALVGLVGCVRRR